MAKRFLVGTLAEIQTQFAAHQAAAGPPSRGTNVGEPPHDCPETYAPGAPGWTFAANVWVMEAEDGDACLVLEDVEQGRAGQVVNVNGQPVTLQNGVPAMHPKFRIVDAPGEERRRKAKEQRGK